MLSHRAIIHPSSCRGWPGVPEEKDRQFAARTQLGAPPGRAELGQGALPPWTAGRSEPWGVHPCPAARGAKAGLVANVQDSFQG